MAAIKGTDPDYGLTGRPRTPMIKEMGPLPGMRHSGNSFPSSVHKTHVHTAEGAPVQHKSPMVPASVGLFQRHSVQCLTFKISSAPHK